MGREKHIMQYIILVLWIVGAGFASFIKQDKDSLNDCQDKDSLNDCEQAQLDSICDVRGHISGGIELVTDMATYEKHIDFGLDTPEDTTDDSTIVLYYNPNYRRYRCLRCGRWINEPVQEKPSRRVIYRHKKGKNATR